MGQIKAKLLGDFVNFMKGRNAFPKSSAFENSVSIRHGVYSRMIKGQLVDVNHIVALVGYLRLAEHSVAEKSYWAALCEFLLSKKLRNVTERSDADVAADLIDTEIDYVGKGPRGLLKAFKVENVVEQSVRGCDNHRDVCNAVRWMFAHVCRDIAPQIVNPSTKAASAVVKAHVGISLADYQKRAIKWHDFDEWTVLIGCGQRKSTAMSIVLPLRDHVYDAVRRGEIATYDVKPCDLERPSRSLLIEACSERIPEVGGEIGNTTRYSAKTLAIQVGVLSYCHGNAAQKPLRLLTFAGTPNARERLKSHGYKRTGSKMPNSKIVLYERIFKWPLSSDDFMFIGALSAFGQYGDKMLKPPLRQKSNCKSSMPIG